MKKLLASLILAAVLPTAISGSAFAAEVPSNFGAEMEKAAKKVMPIPGTDLIAVEVKPGQLVIMTPNKRFAVIGKVVDIFEKKELLTLEDVAAARRVNFKKMGLNFDELATVTFGKGSKEVVVFADPYCEHCTAVLKEAETLGDDYRFKFVLLPMVNHDSTRAVGALICGKLKPSEIISRMKSHQFADLTTYDSDCAQSRIVKTGIVANSFSIYGVPVIFAPNGEQFTGRPPSLSGYLKENSQ